MSARVWISIALLLVVTAWADAQVILELESRDHRTSPPRTETSYVISDGQQLAMGVSRGTTNGDGGVIFRGAARELVVVNHRDQTYMVLDKQAMQSLTGQMNQAMGQIEDAMKHLTPEQQAIVNHAMNGQAPTRQVTQQPPIDARRTRDTATVFGYPATRYEVWRHGRKTREMWVTDWRNVGGSQEVAALFAEMGGFLEELTSSLPGGGAGPAKALDENIFTVMRQIDGFPVGVRDYRPDGTIEREWALRSAKQQRLGSDDFEPPIGYRRQEMFGSSVTRTNRISR